ncbi:methylated-DNA--protein-cysteine methyltransferase [Echinicola pacifica]|uniref:methylated-DNA--[protein]-cysteine S-methyltransferase n=1 Tax=Echinicola pacifica TaxID=346377 RepID=A0A918UK82_9BACT|nr:methylated-DNA--[protein]-cysteine S-methyltransferase [Echinicola pacifica]GGZ15952.1 methylated-DNA--protein-cysteine methyltransferase [Echinicola pacifica]
MEQHEISSQEQNINYRRVEQALEYLLDQHKSQPKLEDIALQSHLSPFHFQRIFSDWVGVSPKKFIQYISLHQARKSLRTSSRNLQETSAALGLSGSARLHDLFVTMEGMTPGEYKNGGRLLEIKYEFVSSPFGEALIASTPKGICHLTFPDTKEKALEDLIGRFPNASFTSQSREFHKHAMGIFQDDWSNREQIKLHLKGSPFQMKVWEALLSIPSGQLSTYGNIAQQINNPAACRAVGTAIGANPIAFLIPCHRVIQSTGLFGGYRWGPVRKTAMIGWEAAQWDKTSQENNP